jgi:tetratricopeptide (TPR) repeat protein
MDRLTVALALIAGAGLAPVAGAQDHSDLAIPPAGNAERAEVSQWIGLVKVSIGYHSPRVHLRGVTDRTGHIWGELVQYGMFDEGFGPAKATPWRAGANESTTLTVSHDVTLQGKPLKAGTYALFLELAPTGPWTLIISKNIGWGSFQYDSANDVLRAAVTPEDAPFTEFLTYGFTDRLPNSAVAYLQWEKKRIPFKFDVPNVNELDRAQIRRDLQSWPGFYYQSWQQAADFAVANRLALEEALVWANRAIYEPFRNAALGSQDFSTFATKARVLQALGREMDADTTMDRAIHAEGATNQYASSLLAAGRKERAMVFFKLNRDRHPDDPFWPYLGLARGYTALGDTKNAIANWEIALKHLPPGLETNRPAFEQALKRLKTGSPS